MRKILGHKECRPLALFNRAWGNPRNPPVPGLSRRCHGVGQKLVASHHDPERRASARLVTRHRQIRPYGPAGNVKRTDGETCGGNPRVGRSRPRQLPRGS
jgi:hypothetical protein